MTVLRTRYRKWVVLRTGEAVSERQVSGLRWQGSAVMIPPSSGRLPGRYGHRVLPVCCPTAPSPTFGTTVCACPHPLGLLGLEGWRPAVLGTRLRQARSAEDPGWWFNYSDRAPSSASPSAPPDPLSPAPQAGQGSHDIGAAFGREAFPLPGSLASRRGRSGQPPHGDQSAGHS
jgi:hypothetical protein